MLGARINNQYTLRTLILLKTLALYKPCTYLLKHIVVTQVMHNNVI